MPKMDHNAADAIIRDIYEGSTLKSVFEKRKIQRQSFYEYIAKYPALQDAYARAQMARAEILADEIITISDTEENGMKARNQIDARKWYASKMQPQKYGDRIDLNVNATVDIAGALADATRRVIGACDRKAAIEADVIEIEQLNQNQTTDTVSVLSTDADKNEPPDIFS